MKRKIVLGILALLLLFTAFSFHKVNATQTIIQLKWTNPMQVYDVAASADGNYVAAVNATGLYYFTIQSPEPTWYYSNTTLDIRSVAISADGDYVVAGDNNGYLHYFNQAKTRTGNQTTPTWTSIDMGAEIEKGTLDMSANGNYVVLGGTGVNIWYFANCTTRTGSGNSQTWASGGGADFWSVHISEDGRFVAGGGTGYTGYGFVVFVDNATARTGYISPKWFAWDQINTSVREVALSDDGYAVAAASLGSVGLHYWANATNLTGDPNATWTSTGSFNSVDMSGDGNKVATGGYYLASIHFWANCRTRNGTQTEDWVQLETTEVYDVAVSEDGNLIACPTMTYPSNYTAYFFRPDGTIINGYALPSYTNMVSMSDNGTTVAMAGPGWDSLYLFKIEEDSTPPAINDVWQQPNSTSVYPYNNVNVFANITDNLSGVYQVTLNYTTGNGTWFTTPMDQYSRDIWNGTIPTFPYCTTITYIITAKDNANNTITSQELGYTLTYHVIPEIAAGLAALTLIVATFVLAATHKKKKKIQT